jgi:predicted amidohydrolase
MRIAVYQGPGADLSLPAETWTSVNLDIMDRTAREASEQGADLVVFPEMFLTNYNIGDRTRGLAEPANGPSAQRATALAKTYGVALCYGFSERECACDQVVYNSMSVIDRRGEIVATYRKSHLFGDDERRYFSPGDELAIVELEGWKLGLGICYDVEFPEFVRALALAGAEALLIPTALMEPYDFVARRLVPARAIENQTYVVYANRCGTEADLSYCGLSCIVDPEGEELARAGGEQCVLYADLSKEAVARARGLNPYLRDRRPELYLSPVRWI